MNNDLLPYMKYLGTGKNGSRSMTQADAREAMQVVLAGAYHPVTFGAFFQSLRFKGETVEETAGLAEAVHCAQSAPPGYISDQLIDCAGAYDGKARTMNVGVAAAIVTAAAGVPVILHGARDIPTKYGMTTSHLLEALGISVDSSLAETAHCLSSWGIAYVHQSEFHPQLHSLLENRHQVGKRTILNTVEPLANPLRAKVHVGGFFHDAYGELVVQACRKANLGFERVILVKGIEGSDELRPGAMCVWELRNGEVSMTPTDTHALGLNLHISELSLSINDKQCAAQKNAKAIEDVFMGEGNCSLRSAILLNAAIRLYAGDAVQSLTDGLQLAEATLADGGASDKLEEWRSHKTQPVGLASPARF